MARANQQSEILTMNCFDARGTHYRLGVMVETNTPGSGVPMPIRLIQFLLENEHALGQDV